MQLTNLLIPLALALSLALACPGQDAAMRDLNTQLTKRQTTEAEDSNELIGDLQTTGATTPIGKQIKEIIVGDGNPESDEFWNPLLFSLFYAKGGSSCTRDTCCIWKWIALDMEKKFKGTSGRCNGFARAAIRLGFHDAGAWSKSTGYGGADGSIVLSDEGARPENNGLQEISAVTLAWHNQYKQYGVGMADLIQFGANVATVVCPLGPRVRTYIGRKDSDVPNAGGLLPGVDDTAENLIKMFEDKTIRPHGLTALLGAHTTSQQRFVDPSRANDPQDSTPGVWDVKFYGQTLGTEATPERVFKFASDVKLSVHPRMKEEWKAFSGNGQEHWNADYAREYIRLSLLGVNNINQLQECTKVLPREIKAFSSPDQQFINQWLAGGLPNLGQTLRDATTITNSLLSLVGSLLGRSAEKLTERAWTA